MSRDFREACRFPQARPLSGERATRSLEGALLRFPLSELGTAPVLLWRSPRADVSGWRGSEVWRLGVGGRSAEQVLRGVYIADIHSLGDSIISCNRVVRLSVVWCPIRWTTLTL